MGPPELKVWLEVVMDTACVEHVNNDLKKCNQSHWESNLGPFYFESLCVTVEFLSRTFKFNI